MQNSTVLLPQVGLFSSKNVNSNGDAVKGTATALSTTSIDLKMLDDNFITGAILIASGVTFGDYVQFQVVDVDNVLGYGVNTILGTYINKWYLKSDRQEQFNESLVYPAKLPALVYLRLKYTSTGTTPVEVAINYRLHKALY